MKLRIILLAAALVIGGVISAPNRAADALKEKGKFHAGKVEFPGPLQEQIDALKKAGEADKESIPWKKYTLLSRALNHYENDLKLSYAMTLAELKDKDAFRLEKTHTPDYFTKPFKNNTSVKSEHTPDFYNYSTEGKGFEAWVDFANADLGGGVFGNGFVQEEVMCCEMPELANAAAVFKKEKLSIRYPDTGKGVLAGSPSPWIFMRVNRVMEVTAYGNDPSAKHTLAEKTADLIDDDHTLPYKNGKGNMVKPAVVNILAIAAPHLEKPDPKVQAALETVKDLFNTCVAGFTVTSEAGGKDVLIHTGALGTGDFHNSRCVVYVLQRLAANQVGVNLKFWGYTDADVKKFDPIYEDILKAYDSEKTKTVERLLELAAEHLEKAPSEHHSHHNNLHHHHTTGRHHTEGN